MKKFRFALDLQLFSEDGDFSGVDDVSAAGAHEGTEGSGVEDPAAAEPNEKAFASRLAAERAKIEREYAERYKDYDTHKRISDYFQQSNGMDAMTLRERVELEALQEQADQQNVPVEVMMRLQELEAKAAQADTLAQQQQQTQWEQTYWGHLNSFVADKEGADPKAINQFLIDNGLSVNPDDPSKVFDLAYRALQYDALQKQLQGAEQSGMKKLLAAKGSIPNITGTSGAQGQTASTGPKTFAEARARAMQRFGG